MQWLGWCLTGNTQDKEQNRPQLRITGKCKWLPQLEAAKVAADHWTQRCKSSDPATLESQ